LRVGLTRAESAENTVSRKERRGRREEIGTGVHVVARRASPRREGVATPFFSACSALFARDRFWNHFL